MVGGPWASAADVAEQTMRTLLAREPDAIVAAIDENGLFVEIPSSIPITTHRVSTARSAMDLVSRADRYRVMDAWAQARSEGMARLDVTLVGATAASATMSFIDVTASHGVFVGVAVTGQLAAIDEIVEIPVPPPRLVRTRKNELAVLVDVDPRVTAMLGWAPDELVGKRSIDFIHPDDHELAINTWMDVLGVPGGTCRSRLRHQHRDGHWKWLEISNRNLLDDPSAGYVDCEMLDVSEEMEAHEALRASEQLLRRLAAALPVGVAQADADGTLLYANDRLFEIFGAPNDATPDELRSALVDKDAIDAALAEVYSGSDVDLQVHVDRIDGSGRRLCTVALRALTNTDGTVIGCVSCVTDITEEARLRDALEERATIDDLTGCVNRATVIALLEDALTHERHPTAVVFVDLDGFKDINDVHGHGAGDELLAAVGARLRDAIRGHDVVGRLGGDEFLIVCPDVPDTASAEELSRRVAAAVAEPLQLGEFVCRPSASVGFALSTAGGDHRDASGLIAAADAAMYAAKRARKPRSRGGAPTSSVAVSSLAG